MLTIKSKFINYKDRQGELYTADDLTDLFSALIMPDIVNFPKNKNRNFGYGFTKEIAAKVYDKLTLKKDVKILIINDISLQMYNKLTDEGYKRENIYLAFGKWNKKAEAEDCKAYEVIEDYIRYNFADELNIIKLKEIFTMGIKIDGIIANPPYGAIGANITDTIREKINFDDYVNLLPANDYKRNKNKDLFNYQSDMVNVNDGFADAAVTTHLAKISKTKTNNMTLDEFERSQYIDPQLDKYFAENSKRNHYAIDAAVYKPKLATFKTAFDLTKCLFIGKRYISDEHLPYTKDCAGYKVNKERNITHDELIVLSAKSEQANGNVGDFSLIQFTTTAEQNNITDFLYSKNGFKFFAKVVQSINADSYCNPNKFLSKVDWTRSWTVEEILADYGYTTEEIKEVMDDLENFKGMDD